MTVGNNSNKAELEGPFYVRVQILPADTCQEQVRDFFKSIPVPPGGVSIHKSCAFVAFDSQVDARLAVTTMDFQVLGGKVVRVSNAEHDDVQRKRLYDVRRQLVPEFWAAVVKGTGKKAKRIRPTMVKDCVVASKKFCPDEIELPGHRTESCSVVGNVLEKKNKTFLLKDSVSEKKSTTCLVGGNFPEKKNKTCLVEGNVPEKNNLTCLVEGNVPEKKNESCLLEEKVSEKEESLISDNVVLTKNGYCLLDDNIPTKNYFCLLDGNVSGKNNSSLPDDQVSLKVSESCVPGVNVPVRNKSCLLIGKLSGKVNDSIFQAQKTSEQVKRIPMKKTIKPTPVFTLSQFKLVY